MGFGDRGASGTFPVSDGSQGARRVVPLRWIVISVFFLSSALNYLDRLILSALAPVLKDEFRLSNAEFGLIISAFSITYALSSPLAGLFIDRVGLNRAISLLVGLWSVTGVATGLVSSLRGMIVCRAFLGIAEAGGIPAGGKAVHTYLQPQERALGAALSQAGLSLGSIVAPLLATVLAIHYGWRAAFIATGAAGLLWIPAWLLLTWKARGIEAPRSASAPAVPAMLREGRLWGLVIANVLSMTVYTLWTNWTTLYLVQEHRLSLVEANALAWIPPLAATLGGLLGGWMSMRWMNAGWKAVPARLQACRIGAFALLMTLAVPLMPSGALATAMIAMSFFWSSAWSVNLYSMPLDIYGGERAAFAVSMLTLAYGVIQFVVSPLIGAMVDRHGFSPVCVGAAFMPLAAYGVLRLSQGRQ